MSINLPVGKRQRRDADAGESTAWWQRRSLRTALRRPRPRLGRDLGGS
jgi:hypothetical protein